MGLKSVMIFFAGFFSCLLLILLFNFEPTFLGFSILGTTGSPSDYINEDNISVLYDKIIISIENASISSYANSGSMVPFLDNGTNGIRVAPRSEDGVSVGDIVSFRFGEVLVVHRVVEKGVDEDGTYYVVRGDANLVGDGKIRFEDIEYVTVGILY